ncbi:unnamed protein product [Arctogadus glacialis]
MFLDSKDVTADFSRPTSYLLYTLQGNDGWAVTYQASLTLSDSAEYQFRITTNYRGAYSGDRGVKLSVTDIQMEVVIRPSSIDTSSDSGQYLCKAENDLGTKSSPFSIDVKYAPKTPSVSVRPPGEIKEGGSVTLSCSSDANLAADYTWFREHGGSVEELGENYTISNITTELGGNYYCEARNAVGLQNSTLMFLNVTATSSSPSSVTTTTVAREERGLLGTHVAREEGQIPGRR